MTAFGIKTAAGGCTCWRGVLHARFDFRAIGPWSIKPHVERYEVAASLSKHSEMV